MDHSNRKFLAVLLGTLSLIPLVLSMPGVYDSMPTRPGVILGIAPLAIFAAAASSFKAWEMPSFFCGLALILLGVGFFVLQGTFGSAAKIGEASGRLSKADVKFWTDGIELWIYTIPLISMGIGINVVSAFISSERPNIDSPSIRPDSSHI